MPVPSKKYPGLFITLEGTDGAGKTYQARSLLLKLKKQGYQVKLTEEPGGTRLGKRLRKILVERNSQAPSPFVEALLYAAARRDHIDRLILPALQKGKIVISSRFADSTMAYQGAGRGLDWAKLSALDKWTRRGLKPDLTLVLDLPPGEGLGRAKKRSRLDRFEMEGIRFQKKVRSYFRMLAKKEPGRVQMIDARASKQVVFERLWEPVKRMLDIRIPNKNK